jgi:metal-sulfur cluster biosynthetic enzyme
MAPNPINKGQVLEALRTVIEPDTGCSIVDLGLVLSVDVVDHGLTAVVKVVQEPLARRLIDPIRAALESIPDLMDGRLEFVKEPVWDPESMATDQARGKLAELASIPRDPATEEDIWHWLSQLIEPEIGLSMVDLGMIYGVDLAPDGRTANIRLTLTTPMCPFGPQIVEMVRQGALLAKGLDDVTVELVWDPPWDPRTMATEDCQMELGIY